MAVFEIFICRMPVAAVLHVHHGGCFQKVPHLVYGFGDMKKVERDSDYLSVRSIKGIIVELGYNAKTIKKIYFSKPELPFEDSLVSIESDEEVRELIVLCKSFEYVQLYVEHNDVHFIESPSNDNESDDGHSDCMANDEYDEYGSDVEDEEVARVRGTKKKMHDDIVADLEGLRAENGENWEGSNAFDDIYAHYQDSDDADSPLSSETDGDGDDKGKKKRKMRYPRYNASPSKEGVELEIGLKFINKEQLREAVEDYRIIKGYDIRIQHSDRKRFQAFCNAKGCDWFLWASRPQGEKSFQIRKMPNPHTCIPFSFERGKRRISTRWLSHKYMKTLRLQPSLKVRELKNLIEKKHNYKATMSKCFKVRAKALALIVGDYKGQFGMIRAYANELLHKNKDSTIRITVKNNGDGNCVFKSLYICLVQMSK